MSNPTIRATDVDVAFDARWAAWVARGRVHEKRVRRRLMICGALLVAGGAVVYALIGF